MKSQGDLSPLDNSSTMKLTHAEIDRATEDFKFSWPEKKKINTHTKNQKIKVDEFNPGSGAENQQHRKVRDVGENKMSNIVEIATCERNSERQSRF